MQHTLYPKCIPVIKSPSLQHLLFVNRAAVKQLKVKTATCAAAPLANIKLSLVAPNAHGSEIAEGASLTFKLRSALLHQQRSGTAAHACSCCLARQHPSAAVSVVAGADCCRRFPTIVRWIPTRLWQLLDPTKHSAPAVFRRARLEIPPTSNDFEASFAAWPC